MKTETLSENLYELAHKSLLDLSTNEGINASGRDEIYGCIFGRDSAITILKILRAHSKHPTPDLLEVSKNALLTLTRLQGKETNLESGEQPGKFIHEFRKDKFEHLTCGENPWFVYPDQVLKNYDSIDSTPLTLMAIHSYWNQTQDKEFLISVLPAVEAGLNWIITYGDIDKDGLIEYVFPHNRRFGGLVVQSWTDSHESIRQADGNLPKYPIAPVEAQAFAWLALKQWGDFYLQHSPKFAKKLLTFADKMKEEFNQRFILKDGGLFFAAQALDGDKKQIKTITANPLLCLWAAYQKDGRTESIVNPEYVPDFIKRAFKKDLFVKNAGIRTMSTKSPTFNPARDSYHNGSFWPMLNGLVSEGLENFKYSQEAEKIDQASLSVFRHFGSPIELFIREKNGRLVAFQSQSGQKGCETQAWSAAAFLDIAAKN